MGAGIRVCPACGVIAPTSRTSCSVCQAPFGPQPLVASGRSGSMVFACIHAADFTCKACGIRSPLASVDCGGEAECMGCGLRQAFDAVQWTDALGFAHGVADLSGPNLDHVSSRSRHAKIGTEFTSSTKTQNSMIMDGRGTRTHSLRTSVSPGHPLCVQCKNPLDAQIDASGALATRCGRCGDTATYALPPNATATYGALRGVLSHEQRTDKPIAKLGRTQAGVESIVCPQCGAGISAGSGSELSKCTYCGLAVRVPGTLARQQRKGAPPKMDPFWVLLEGPSIGRQRLMRGKSEDPDDGDDDDDDDDDDVPSGPSGFAPAGYGTPMAPAWAHPNMAPPPKKSGALTAIIVVAVLGILFFVLAGAGAAFYFMTAEEEPPPPAAPATPARPVPPPKKR